MTDKAQDVASKDRLKMAQFEPRNVMSKPPDTPSTAPAGGGRKAFGDGAISAVERIVSQAAQFAIFIVAARMLGPDEFGIFALVSACAILLLRVAEVGWSPFIMSWSGDATVPRQVLFIAVLSSFVFGAVGLLAAVVVNLFDVSDTTISLIVLFAIWAALANISSAQDGMMIWLGKLKAAALCEIAAEIVGLIVAIAALYRGYGVLSLAFGRLALQTVQLILSFSVTRLAPMAGLRGPVLRELRVFSTQIFISRMLINTRLYMAVFIIGGFLGPTAVGYFRAADRLVSAAAELIVVPAQMLAWTLLRRARDAGEAAGLSARMNATVRKHTKMVFAVGTPLFLWLMLSSADLIHGMLSSEWLPAAPLVGILAFARLLTLFGVVTEPLMSIVGEARRLPLFTATVFVISLALTIGSAAIGLYAVAWAQILISVIVLAATIHLFSRYAGIEWAGIFRDLRGSLLPLAFGGLTVMILEAATASLVLPPLAQALGFGVLALVVYVLATAIFDRRFWKETAAQLKKDVIK